MQAITPTQTAFQTDNLHRQPDTITFGLTLAKIEQLAYSFFALITATAAGTLLLMSCISGAFVPTFLALPFITATGLLIWKIASIKDYDDPEQIAHFRETAHTASLLSTFQEHGAKNMVYYGIPTPDEFPGFQESKMTLSEAIRLHEALHQAFVEAGSDANTLYSEITQAKATFLQSFWESVKDTTINMYKLFETDFDVELLHTHDLLTTSEYEILQNAKKKYDQAYLEYQRDLKKLTTEKDKAERTNFFNQLLFMYHQEDIKKLKGN